MRGSLSPTRRAVTLVELLVVLAIIAGLLALLFPAIQRVRENGRTATCQNNLRQLSIASRGYAEVNHRIPDRPAAGTAGGWSVVILPFMEQAALAERIESRAINALPADLVARLGVFTCPSVPGGDTSSTDTVAHYVLAANPSRDVWWIGDAPTGFTVAWLAGPELPYDQLTSGPGPHTAGVQVVDNQASVQWYERR